MNQKKLFAAAVMSLIMIEILSISTEGSLWPMAVLHHKSLGLRILGWYLTCQFGLALLASLALSTIPNRPCPICNMDLKTYGEVHGGLTRCTACGTTFHRNCLRSKRRCPICFPEDEAGPDIGLDFTRRFPSE